MPEERVRPGTVGSCGGTAGDNGVVHHSGCYCKEDQGHGYTYDDEYGACAFCLGEFREDTVICADTFNELRACPEANAPPP